MTDAIAWSGFIGGWLLFAGPVYQAANELREHEFDQEGFRETVTSVELPPRPSGWWWLLPPVAFLLIRRHDGIRQQAVWAALTREQTEQLLGLKAKASGWLIVAGGAFLIAVKETWELCHHQHWSDVVCVVLILAMALLGVLNTAVRMVRAAQLRAGPRS